MDVNSEVREQEPGGKLYEKVSHTCSYHGEFDIECYVKVTVRAAARILIRFNIAQGELAPLVCDKPKTLATSEH